jgi:hypothetical protein
MTIKDLYEQDYLAWLEETAKQLRQRQTDLLDWEHLREEIEALGNEQREHLTFVTPKSGFYVKLF